MKDMGITLIIICTLLLIASFGMPLTVGDTYNIGKIHISNSMLLLAGFCFVSAIILFVGDIIRNTINRQPNYSEVIVEKEPAPPVIVPKEYQVNRKQDLKIVWIIFGVLSVIFIIAMFLQNQ